MENNKYENPFIEEFASKLAEFERRIDEDNYNSCDEGFEDEFYQLKDDLRELYHECWDNDQENIVRGFEKKLNIIRDEEGLYNEEEELDRMFPNRESNSDDDDFDEGFSADKYFGLD